MATQTPTIRTTTRAAADGPPMWLRRNIGGTASEEDDVPYIGEVRMFAGALPAKWLNLSNNEVSRTTYAELFAYLGIVWGAGDGSTTFGLPPCSRVPIAAGSAVGLSTYNLGDVGGQESQQLTSTTSGIRGGIPMTVYDPTHFHGSGSIGDSGHAHGASSVMVNINDLGHVHPGDGAIPFIAASGATQYPSAAADAGGQLPNTGSALTGITASLTGNVESANAAIGGVTSAAGSGISVDTVATDAEFPFTIMNPFAAYNFGIYANA